MHNTHRASATLCSFEGQQQIQCMSVLANTQRSVACKLQVIQRRSYEVGNSGRGHVCLEGGVLQCSEWIRGAAHRHGQGSSRSKEGSLSLSLLRHIHLCHMWTDLFISYRPVQLSTKPSLRFVMSTTHSIHTQENCLN